MAAACSKEPAPSQNDIERGKYLVTFGGCHDCHTPKIPGPNGVPVLDTTKLLAGHPENSPAPSWSPEDIRRKNVVAATNESLTAWARSVGCEFRDQSDARQSDRHRRVERRKL